MILAAGTGPRAHERSRRCHRIASALAPAAGPDQPVTPALSTARCHEPFPGPPAGRRRNGSDSLANERPNAQSPCRRSRATAAAACPWLRSNRKGQLGRESPTGIPELTERRRRSSKRTAPLEQLTDPASQPTCRHGPRLASEWQPTQTITDPCRFRAARSCAVCSTGSAQISPFWMLADFAIVAVPATTVARRRADRV